MMSSALLRQKAAVRSLFYEGGDFGTLQQHVWAVVLGLLTGLIGAGYSLLLDVCLEALWKALPERVLDSHKESGPLYILLVVGVGALVVAILGAVLPNPGNMDEWIDMLHKTGVYPSSRLLPMTLLSFVTAAAGFSVGPEAPMVIVGAVCGSTLAHLFKQSTAAARTMNIAGAAGCLSAFFCRPLVGAFFVLEFPHRLGIQYYEALSPAILASVVSSLVARHVHWTPFGGNYNYGHAQSTLPPTMVWLPLAVGLLAACVAVASVLFMQLLKRMAMSAKHKISDCTGCAWLGPFLVRLLVGLMVGGLGMICPQTLFWGETNLQSAIDGQTTPLYLIGDTPLVRWSIVDVGPSLGSAGALAVCALKILAIALAGAGAFPGGIIYPFFFAGAYLGLSLCGIDSLFQENAALVVICTMAVLQAVITKTPIASLLILMVSASSFAIGGGVHGAQALGAMLPMLVSAMYVGLLLVHPLGVTYLKNGRPRTWDASVTLDGGDGAAQLPSSEEEEDGEATEEESSVSGSGSSSHSPEPTDDELPRPAGAASAPSGGSGRPPQAPGGEATPVERRLEEGRSSPAAALERDGRAASRTALASENP